jgi:hypothetical protein
MDSCEISSRLPMTPEKNSRSLSNESLNAVKGRVNFGAHYASRKSNRASNIDTKIVPGTTSKIVPG